MSNYSGLDDLGNVIESIIDQAVNSQDFQQLNQTIRQALNTAVDTGSDAVRRAMAGATRKADAKRKVVEERKDTPLNMPNYAGSRVERPNVNTYSRTMGSTRAQRTQQHAQLSALYRHPTGKLAGGIVKTVGGGITTLTGLTCSILSSIFVLPSGLPNSIFAASLAVFGGGIWLLSNGIRSITQVGRFGKYLKYLGDKTHCELAQLARFVGKSPKFVRKEIKGMIERGLFLEGHLDDEETSLITSNETYTQYLQAKRTQAVQRQQEAVQAKKDLDAAEKKKHSAQVQEVLDKGNEFIRQIRKCNDDIPGEEISDKISRMETLVQKIFDRAETNPEIVPDLKKLMDYYLPMTVKLLKAYADMDAQPIQGENIQNSKKEIEQTLDTLNAAFEKLLDSVFKATALDVSSDITVLNTLLAQEGLTEDELTLPKRKQN